MPNYTLLVNVPITLIMALASVYLLNSEYHKGSGIFMVIAAVLSLLTAILLAYVANPIWPVASSVMSLILIVVAIAVYWGEERKERKAMHRKVQVNGSLY